MAASPSFHSSVYFITFFSFFSFFFFFFSYCAKLNTVLTPVLNEKKEGLGEPAFPGAIAGQDRAELSLSFGPAVN